MIRKIIEIDCEKCNGCGACASACHEGAIAMINGKATLLRDDYCDGLGDCLPTCPTNAISFVQREAVEYDEIAVKNNNTVHIKQEKKLQTGCPGVQPKTIMVTEDKNSEEKINSAKNCHLSQWPIQIKLVPVNAPYFDNANLLIAADCSAFAYGDFHNKFIKNKITLIGCPKLDEEDYSKKLTEIIKNNNIKSVTVVRMEVPCCGGLENAAILALKNSEKFIPWQVVVIGTKGDIIE